MLVAGIVGYSGRSKTANLINLIFSSSGKKISVIDSKSLIELGHDRIKNYLHELDINKVDILILKIDILDVEKDIFNYLHFDIMIYTDKADDLEGIDLESYKNLMRRIFSLLDEKGIAIINVDDSELIQVLEGMKYYIVTYGFNPKASITTSSVGDAVLEDNFMCCIQRTISATSGLLVEPQEYVLKVEAEGLDTYNVLAAATFAIVNGVDLSQVNSFTSRPCW